MTRLAERDICVSELPPPPVPTVIFIVTGNAPGGVDITYGNDSSNLQGNGLPFKAHLHYDANASYYDVTAQLQGSDLRKSLCVSC